jgi:chemotaxis protein methyltransferase CheR
MTVTSEHVPDAAASDYLLSDREFERVRAMIYREAGIKLASSKRQMVYRRLGRRVRALGLDSFSAYLDVLERGNQAERQEFTNALTTNLTSFFRESHHFPVLADHVLNIGRRREVIVWCSACSTGEEPYSIAMTLIDAFRSWTPPVRILASDVDTAVIEAAARGIYPYERVEQIPERKLHGYFLKGRGANAGSVKVRPELQKLITFRQVNLLASNWPVRGPIDVIFCRNVMIYFDKATQRQILERFHPLMRPEGLMFAGHSESFQHAQDLFRLRGKTVYQLASRPEHEDA